MARAPRPPARASRRWRDDTGGVWIVTGIVLGALLYAGIVLTVIAGFTVAVPLVVIPPVVLGLIAANSLLGGGHSRGAGRDPRAPGPDGPIGPA
jgi:hypothetical protein